MLHDPKTVIRSSFAQETAEKIAPQSIARLELANCTYKSNTFANLTSVMSVSYYLVPRLIGYLHTQGGFGGWLIGVLKID